MNTIIGLILVAGIALAGCGGGEVSDSSTGATAVARAATESSSSTASSSRTAQTQNTDDAEEAPAPGEPTYAEENAAARFLIQATYGPNDAAIDEVLRLGYSAWLERQFNTAPMDSHWDYVMVRRGPVGCNPCDSAWINAVMESFWLQAVKGPDQLRQRTVFALSQIFVVSTVNSAVEVQPDAHSSYLDMLSRNAFGNFRTLLEQVATHPTMAHYLSHMKNMREDASTGRLPDENFAREIMQLMSIGLWELNEDGTRRKDSRGNDIPTYSQNDVMGLAKVFTGWSWNGRDRSESTWQGWNGFDWRNQLQNYPQYHSTSAKTFLGTTIPANTDGVTSLRRALDTLFNHPNVGPFIGEQLIKRFVTSNPSRDYVRRVAQAFNNNGQGVRGDMKAVIRAVLMDREARDDSKVKDPEWGKLREPMIRYANFMRAFNVSATSGYYRIWNLEDPVSSLGQNPLRAPSVFNWFRPTYAPPGDIMARGKVAPEFQISHETTVTGYANFITETAERQTRWWRDTNVRPYTDSRHYLAADYSPELAVMDTPWRLLRRVNLLLMAGQMSERTKENIREAIKDTPANINAGNTRVATAVALTMLSPEYIVQK